MSPSTRKELEAQAQAALARLIATGEVSKAQLRPIFALVGGWRVTPGRQELFDEVKALLTTLETPDDLVRPTDQPEG